MATYAEWNRHFDGLTPSKLTSYQKAIKVLLGDKMIKQEYGHDLGSLDTLMNASKNSRK